MIFFFFSILVILFIYLHSEYPIAITQTPVASQNSLTKSLCPRKLKEQIVVQLKEEC